MSEPKPAVASEHHDGPAGSRPIFHTPVAIVVARGFQAFFAFVILILAGIVIHGLALDAVVFGLVCVGDSALSQQHQAAPEPSSLTQP